MSRWRKRKPSSSGNVGDVERISSLRTSVARCASTPVARIGRELRDRAAVEHLALDGSALHDHAHVAVERVDPRLEERLDRRGNDDLAFAAVLAHHREHLLDVERVPGRRRGDPLAQLGVERRVRHEAVDELLALLGARAARAGATSR